MKKHHITTTLEVYESISELEGPIQALMHKAQVARDKAYAPYSRFKVGAALLLDNDEVVTGNNQENAAFPSGLCAERVAVFYAGAEHPGRSIKALALTVHSETKNITTPVPPCGACRQSLAEYEVRQEAPIEIYFMGATGKVVKAASVEALLPLVFDSSFL
ncbi:cytidine deaminase [Altibacter sp. HG106]|uniref:cytidine deaminase n=1 Tax=Altibacter sp. HG106 TaxID=3023937 RepID=UPI002350346C|nr:cytidine deaminase [Altibacter sp. HG106]MDC7995947.1 cytidine deaminase [Altibacter sp. HG106]